MLGGRQVCSVMQIMSFLKREPLLIALFPLQVLLSNVNLGSYRRRLYTIQISFPSHQISQAENFFNDNNNKTAFAPLMF